NGGVTCNVQAGAPEDEQCNDIDDDCNGIIDNIEPLQGCYDGPDGTMDIGACHAGQQSCRNGEWGACENQVIPGVEICDSVDNDCDDEVDEQGPHADMCEESCMFGATRACYTGPEGTQNTGSCGPGQQACDDVSMRWGPCEGETLPGPLQCGGVDNNCDGQVDNVPGGCGICNPTPEVCDQVDNNCDGVIDNGLPLNNCGVCGPAPEEVCNGEDDDCDGEVDNGVANACGFCGELPQEVCNGFDDDCDGEVDNTGLEEICNGVDDDCDGEIDNGLENCCAGEEISPELACAPSGEFMMGPPDRLHQQVLFTYAFVAFKAETTQNLWNQHMDQNPSVHVGGALPVHNLLISEAAEFANTLSLSQDLETCYTFTDNGRVQFSGGLDCRGWRIPTEAEWEYAASAGGNQAGTYGNLQEIAVSSIPPSNNPSPLAVCGGRPTNAWGMCDSLGNISELVWDGRYDYIRNVLQIDPSGAPELPDATGEIGARGGSWYNENPDQFRTFQRGFDQIDVRSLKGIRLVRTFSHPAW
ncbi:MAG: SUMF1/EgtB/PvdO family nonheme iron enzyme, partial [Candidatus Magasanikbacteria bacterium]|nr:SUMF1/EgtB/PvdO family nonheme iron enzyme [Candidatus Magasanikbacteria bacterium]